MIKQGAMEIMLRALLRAAVGHEHAAGIQAQGADFGQRDDAAVGADIDNGARGRRRSARSPTPAPGRTTARS